VEFAGLILDYESRRRFSSDLIGNLEFLENQLAYIINFKAVRVYLGYIKILTPAILPA